MKTQQEKAKYYDIVPSQMNCNLVAKYAPTPVAYLMVAKTKPKRVSEQRWRMELARREKPEYYAECGEACK